MQAPKWFIIARNGYRVSTSGIRAIRRYFPYIMVGLLAVYVLYVAPTVIGFFIDDFLALIISTAAIPIIQMLLFIFFFYMIIFPIQDTLREVKAKDLQIFLAAPVKPSDVLLGEFLGRMPFYIIAIAIITGTFTALLGPLGLDYIQNIILIVVLVIIFLSALWIGTVVSALLKTKLSKSVRGKDIGRGLSMILALPGIAVLYAMIGGGLTETLMNPNTSSTVRTILNLLPSSWGAEIFVAFASNPSNMNAVYLQSLTLLGGLIIFFIAALWLGTKVAGRAYNLDVTSFIAPIVKPDGLFYRTIRSVGGGGSSGILLITTFKEYARRLENLSYIIYTIGIVTLMTIFIVDPFENPNDILMFTSMLALPFLTSFVVGTISRGKENFFLYLRSPKGISKFVKGRLLQGWLVALPIIVAIMAILMLILPEVAPLTRLMNIALISLRTVVLIVLILGLALLIPVFSEESRGRMMGIMINLQIAVFGSIGLELGLSQTGLSFGKLFPNMDKYIAASLNHLMITAIILLIGVLILYLGIKRLKKLE